MFSLFYFIFFIFILLTSFFSVELLKNRKQIVIIAGAKHLASCHGSMGTATCRKYKHLAPFSEILYSVMDHTFPYCKKCSTEPGIMKPDVVFFGENLP
jgi:NAD-dependent SIR2 family protein deacetylase